LYEYKCSLIKHMLVKPLEDQTIWLEDYSMSLNHIMYTQKWDFSRLCDFKIKIEFWLNFQKWKWTCTTMTCVNTFSLQSFMLRTNLHINIVDLISASDLFMYDLGQKCIH